VNHALRVEVLDRFQDLPCPGLKFYLVHYRLTLLYHSLQEILRVLSGILQPQQVAIQRFRVVVELDDIRMVELAVDHNFAPRILMAHLKLKSIFLNCLQHNELKILNQKLTLSLRSFVM